MYHYAGNNPVCYSDPNGKFFNVIAAVAGGVIGAGVGAVVAAGTDMQDIFNKVLNCIQNIDPSKIAEKSNELRTTINGIETTVRFYVQNGQVININAFVGYTERAIGNLIQ